jgi:hypothetical protein
MHIIKLFALKLALLLVLTGCSQATTVHLYGRYLTEAQTNDISQALTTQGFEVTVNQLAFPQNINQATLIYGMPMDRPQEVDQIKLIAQTQGWPLQDAQSLVKGNHWYSGNAVGLFLLPAGVTPNQLSSVDDLSFTYQSEGCKQQVQLKLTADQRFHIEPETGDMTAVNMLQGEWLVRQLPYLELRPEGYPDWSYYLEISRSQTQDNISQVQQLILTPLQTYPIFGSCYFVHGVRL